MHPEELIQQRAHMPRVGKRHPCAIRQRTPPIRPGRTSAIDDFGMSIVERSRDVESRAVAAVWFNPVAGYNFAVEHGVGEDSFGDQRLGRAFAYSLACAANGLAPIVNECVAVCAADHIPIDANWWLWPILLRPGLRAHDLEVDIAAVAFFGRWRDDIHSRLRALSASLPRGYKVSITPAANVAPFVPRRTRKEVR